MVLAATETTSTPKISTRASVDQNYRIWSSFRHGPFSCALNSAAPCVTRIAYKQFCEYFQPAYSYSAGRHGRRGGSAGYRWMLWLWLWV
jgi:hypothetical protein